MLLQKNFFFIFRNLKDDVDSWHKSFEESNIEEFNAKKAKTRKRIAIGFAIGIGIVATAITGGALAPILLVELGALGIAGAAASAGIAAGAGVGATFKGIEALRERIRKKRLSKARKTQQKVENLASSSDAVSPVEDQVVEGAETDLLLPKDT